VILREGDIVSIDVGAYYKNYHGDAARTYAVGQIAPEARRLIDVTRESFYRGIEEFREGNRLEDISHAIQTHIESNGYHVVRDLIGHGIGTTLHQEPDVPNFGRAGRGVRLRSGMTLAIEPMVGMGTYHVYQDEDDGWTIRTMDHSLAAHYENTVALLDGRQIILTQGGEEI
jgi:methionyl aminopeptidase